MVQDTWEKMTFDERWGKTHFNPETQVDDLAGVNYDDVRAGVKGILESEMNSLSPTGKDWADAGLAGADELYQLALRRGSGDPEFLASLFALDTLRQAQERDADLVGVLDSFNRK